MNAPPTEPVPALFEHCVSVYERMKEESTPHPSATLEDGTPVPMYQGFLTHLFADLGLSVPYYTKVLQHLKAMDCVRQIRRGGGPSPSKWLLMQPPTMEAFDAATPKKERVSKTDILEQQVRDMQRQINDMQATNG